LDHAVSLVQAYLQLNGYFTSAEYPVVAQAARGGFRALTDIDILAFRFPASHPGCSTNGSSQGLTLAEPDPGLGVPADRVDMIIGEVKEGKVNFNSGVIDPDVLRTVLRRFGCNAEETESLVNGLLDSGSVTVPSGYQVRLIAFGAFPPGSAVPPCRIISLGHVLEFLQVYVHEHWEMLRHCQFKDPAFGFLMTLEKARRGEAGRRGTQGVEVVPPISQRARPTNDRRQPAPPPGPPPGPVAQRPRMPSKPPAPGAAKPAGRRRRRGGNRAPRER
jgi:hypothetical protein